MNTNTNQTEPCRTYYRRHHLQLYGTVQPRLRGRGFETAEQAAERARFDLALVAALSDAGLRRSEAAALTWGLE